MRDIESNSTTLGVSEGLSPCHVRADEIQPVPTLTILYHPDLARIGDRLVLSALPAGREVAIHRLAPAFTAGDGRLGKPLDDPFISRDPLLLKPGSDGAVWLTPGRTLLRVDGADAEPSMCFEADHLADGVLLELAERILLLFHLWRPVWDAPAHGLIGASEGLLRVRQAIDQVADLMIPVLLRGESGVGKELVASAIHHSGPRCKGPFVSVNLGALTPSLAASELFGAARGAYTGSVQARQGLFRRAHGGTLFLDEIGEAPADVQVMLLRVLETGEVTPVGSDHALRADVRIVAATDADLEAMTENKDFRLPLLHRLAGFELRLPPLRERREDIGLLLRHFLRHELAEVGELQRLSLTHPDQASWLPVSLLSGMFAYPWPGNIREFRNVLRQLVIANRGRTSLVVDEVIAEKLIARDAVQPTAASSGAKPGASRPQRRKPSSIGEQELFDALAAENWDLEGASRRLNVARSSLYPLIRKSPRIRTAADLSSEEISACFHRFDGELEQMVAHLMVSGKALKRRIYELGLASRESAQR